MHSLDRQHIFACGIAIGHGHGIRGRCAHKHAYALGHGAIDEAGLDPWQGRIDISAKHSLVCVGVESVERLGRQFLAVNRDGCHQHVAEAEQAQRIFLLQGGGALDGLHPHGHHHGGVGLGHRHRIVAVGQGCDGNGIAGLVGGCHRERAVLRLNPERHLFTVVIRR